MESLMRETVKVGKRGGLVWKWHEVTWNDFFELPPPTFSDFKVVRHYHLQPVLWLRDWHSYLGKFSSGWCWNWTWPAGYWATMDAASWYCLHRGVLHWDWHAFDWKRLEAMFCWWMVPAGFRPRGGWGDHRFGDFEPWLLSRIMRCWSPVLFRIQKGDLPRVLSPFFMAVSPLRQLHRQGWAAVEVIWAFLNLS